MNRIVKAVVTFLAVGALPLASVAPASATSNFSQWTTNCGALSTGDWQFPFVESSVTITFEDCNGTKVWDDGNTGNASIAGTEINGSSAVTMTGSSIDITVVGEVTLRFTDSNDSPLDEFRIETPLELENPLGVLLDEEVATIPSTMDETTFGDPSDFGINGYMLAGNCEVLAGTHAYATSDLSISEAGDYAIRVVGQSPEGDLFHPNNEYNPYDDSVMVVYSSFDPTAVDENIVGCADQMVPYGDEDFDWFTDSSGHLLSTNWPYIDYMSLDAGTYTVVYLTYNPMTSDDWAIGDDGYATWDTATTFSSTFELWGPANGGYIGDGSSEDSNTADDTNLASTGVNASFGIWAGLGLLVTGAAITVVRRRAQRA